VLRRIYPEQPLVGVGALIIARGKILLGKRKNEPRRGQWSIPGGLVELGESVEQTAIREVKEETGLEVEKPEHIDVVDNIDLDEEGKVKYHFIIIDYLVKLKGGSVEASSDAAELRWVAFENVGTYDLTPTFKAFFLRNRQNLEKLSSYP
jgi:ADP-ribose pyrophosphatase YjhB (NUDIX family)